MSRSLDAQVEQVLDVAEREHRYAFATTTRGKNALARRLRAGRLASPWQGLFCRPAYLESLNPSECDLHLLRSLARKNPSYVFAGPSAALAHGLWVPRSLRRNVHLATSRTSHSSSSGPLIRHIVDTDARSEPLGIPCTPFERTVFDCLRSCEFHEGLPIADSAIKVPGMTLDVLIEYFDGLRSGHHGAPHARRVLACADARSGSPGESALRARLIQLGYQIPQLQILIADPLDQRRPYEIDMGYPQADGSWLLIEFDGEGKRGETAREIKASISRERRRESRLTLLRNPILRVGWEDLQDDAHLHALLNAFGAPKAR